MKRISKVNFNILLMALTILLTSCGNKKEIVYGTIEDVKNDEINVTATDNLGNEIRIARRIEDTYPELDLYSGADKYPGIYVPILNRCFDSEKFHLITTNPECVIFCDSDDPKTTFTFGRINDIRVEAYGGEQSDMFTFLSTVIPMTEFGYYKDSKFSVESLIRADIISTTEDMIGDITADGYKLNAITEADKDPGYVYFVCDKSDDDALFALMTSYNIDENGNLKSAYELERNKENRIYKEGKPAPQTVYKIFKSTITLAVPSYMKVEEGSNGFRVRERDGEATPFSGSGCTVIYTAGGVNTKEQAETLKAELNSLGGKDYKYDILDAQYEENVDFMGVSDATHLSGLMRCNDSGLTMRSSICGTGEIYYDIFYLNRNGKDMLVMFYRGQPQNEEFSDFIRYNTY